jgi:bla regulator protein BlaR1
MMRTIDKALVLAMALSGIAVFSMAQTTQKPAFEVASIRLHKAQIQSIGAKISGARLMTEAMSADDLIAYAYDVKIYQVFGVPSWATSKTADCDRYDINAKAEGDAPLKTDQARALLQSLLAERFHLQFHREMKDTQVYALVVAKSGHKLKEHTSDEQGGLRMRGGSNGIELTSTGSPISLLVSQISNHNGVDRIVVDRTGLTGNYDYKLTWAAGLAAARNDSDALTIFTALQEQLGLRLEPQPAPIELLVVDHIERPSEN